MCGKLAIKTSKIGFFWQHCNSTFKTYCLKNKYKPKKNEKNEHNIYNIYTIHNIVYNIYVRYIKWMMMRPKTIVSVEYRPWIEVAVHNTNGKNKVRLGGLVIEFPTR